MTAEQTPERTIRFFADWAGSPLWGPGIGPTDPAALALAAPLAERLRAYDAYHSRFAPTTDDERWPDDAATAHHEDEERLLPAAVALEIGPGAWVERPDGGVEHAAVSENAAAAEAFEQLVAAEAADAARVAALRAAGGVFTGHGASGSVYQPPDR